VAASGVRISWMQIPARVRAAIEAIIGGGATVTAVSQSGGFSPGTADRVVNLTSRRSRALTPLSSPVGNGSVSSRPPT